MDYAQALYGAPSAAAPASPPVTADAAPKSLADRMYPPPAAPAKRDDTPPEVAAARAADPERQLFDAGLADASAVPKELVEQHGIDAAEWAHVTADLGATRADLNTFSQLAGAHLAQPASSETVDAWTKESMTLIKDRAYSASDMAGARQLVARDPRLKELLDGTGLGSHPKVVARMVELARSARTAGKLK